MPSKQVKLDSDSDRHHAIMTEVGLPILFHFQLSIEV